MEKSRGPFRHVVPPPQAGRGAPVRRDKRRGIFLPGRSPYPALLHSPSSLPKVSFLEVELRGFLSFYVSYHLFPGIYFMIGAYSRERIGLYDENRNCYPLYFRGRRDRHPPLGPCWDILVARGLVGKYIGAEIGDIHAPRDIIIYLAFYSHLGVPFFTAMEQESALHG